jgi:hypothetical protein
VDLEASGNLDLFEKPEINPYDYSDYTTWMITQVIFEIKIQMPTLNDNPK